MNKILHLKDFVKNTRELLDNCELTDSKSINDKSVWKSIGKPGKGFFVIKKSANYYYFQGLNYIHKQLEKNKVTISEEIIEHYYVNFLDDKKRSENNLYDECELWLDNLVSKKPQKIKYLLPLNHYEYHGEIKLEKIRIVKITDELLINEFNTKSVSEIITSKELIDINETNIFAIIEINTYSEFAEELAYRIIEKFIYAVKLIDPGSYIHTRKWSLHQVNEGIVTLFDDNPSWDIRSHHVPARILPNDEFYKKFQTYWDKLTSFLYSDNLTNLQKVILSSLYWYGETDVRSDSKVKQFLNFITGLELIMLHLKKRGEKNEIFAKNCAKIFSGDEKYSDFWKKYYLKRNDLLHQEIVTVYQEESDTLWLNLRTILLLLVDFSDKYDSLSDLFENEYGISEL